ncbi:MAG: hypothetical protein ACI87N_001896 [Flavobacteriales bacterium]|jgi:hypothetical protein
MDQAKQFLGNIKKAINHKRGAIKEVQNFKCKTDPHY